jgi:hypothetical protein
MPIKITIKLMSGDILEYVARPYQGRARFRTHQPRMEEMVLNHLGLGSYKWRVKLVHEDDLERMIANYKESIRQRMEENQKPRRNWFFSIPSEEKQQEEIANLDEGYKSLYRNLIEEQRYYTEDTTVYAIVEESNWRQIDDYLEKMEKGMSEMDLSGQDEEMIE